MSSVEHLTFFLQEKIKSKKKFNRVGIGTAEIKSSLQALETQGATPANPSNPIPSPNPIKFLAKLGWRIASHFWLLLLKIFSQIQCSGVQNHKL